MQKGKFGSVLKGLTLVAAMSMLTGCFGFVDDGEVGVRTQFGKVDLNEVNPGFTTWFASSLDKYTIKETSIDLKDMTPKAGDNLSLRDMDVAVYYTTNPNKIADLQLKYKGQSAQLEDSTNVSGYFLVSNQAKTVVQDEVSKYQSLVIHTKRDLIETNIKAALQANLDETDPGAFKITRIAVSKITTDAAIEDSIRKVVQAQKDNEAMTYKVETATKQAQLNGKLNDTYTAAYLQHEYNVALTECAKRASCTMIVGDVKPLVNLR